METKNFTELIAQATEQLREGAFLVSGDGNNPMTIGWVTFGIVWNKPICTVFVRHSRYSHECMEKKDTFTVSIPKKGESKAQLGFCGSHSGRDTDKLKGANLSLVPLGDEKGIDGCAIHFVCRTVAKTEMETSGISDDIVKRFYNTNQATEDGDPHTIYFGEIIEAFCE